MACDGSFIVQQAGEIDRQVHQPSLSRPKVCSGHEIIRLVVTKSSLHLCQPILVVVELEEACKSTNQLCSGDPAASELQRGDRQRFRHNLDAIRCDERQASEVEVAQVWAARW